MKSPGITVKATNTLDSLAAAFTDLVKSFVSDVLMPPISILLPLNRNMEEKFAVLHKGPNYNKTTGYNTLHQAQEDGAVVLAYGYDNIRGLRDIYTHSK
jgi:large-conductance mechanosensitive channel